MTLSDVDMVVAAAVDDPTNPKLAKVHIFDANEVLSRFDRAYAARRNARHRIPLERGIWVSLYHEETNDPVNRIGAGIGIKYPAIAKVPLNMNDGQATGGSTPPTWADAGEHEDDRPLSIAQAKARLARTLGVEPGSIKITVEA